MKPKPVAVPNHSFVDLLALLQKQQYTEGLYVLAEAGNDFNPAESISYPFRSDHFIIIMQLEGVGYSKVNFTDCTTRKGEMLVIPPNAIRQFFVLPQECCFAAVVFTTNFLMQSRLDIKHTDLFDLFSSTQNYCFAPDTADFDRLKSIMLLLYEKYNTSNDLPFDQHVINHLFHAFLFELTSVYQQINKHKKVQYTRQEDISMRFIELLTASFREERSVMFYAEKLHLTSQYLSQTVKEVTGRSAGELIDEMVVMEAKALLNNISLSISQVAESLYFSDQFFFSKYFKRLAGVSPSEYRKSL